MDLFRYMIQLQVMHGGHLFSSYLGTSQNEATGSAVPRIGYKVINKQVMVQMLIANTAFYIYDTIILKEISIVNSFEQIQENTISGSAFSVRLGRGFHTRPMMKKFCSVLHVCQVNPKAFC